MYNFEKNTTKKAIYFWNLVGSGTRAASSFILLMIVVRVSSVHDAGIFSIAYATSQMFLTIGFYGMRSYQVTDIGENFTFQTYLSSRVITSLMMILGCSIYTIVKGYPLDKALIINFICLLKMVDAVEDVYHGLLQQNGRMDVAGILLTVRNIFSVVLFLLVLLISRNLLLTSILVSVLSLMFCLVLNIYFANCFGDSRFDFSLKPLKKLLIDCFPLCTGHFLSVYIYNIPKYAIDNILSAEYQTYYNIIFMPAFVVNLLSEVVFKPVLPQLAYYWVEDTKKKFIILVGKLIGLIFILSGLSLSFSYILGIPLLSLIYGVDLSSYRDELLIIVAGGGFGACTWLLNNVLTAMRMQKFIHIMYFLVSVIATILAPMMVTYYGITGGAWVYFLSVALLSFFFILVLLINSKKKNVEH